ncbi:MAG: MBL fold metallo-hydrolase [Acidimicrobiia bacterium]|nr:MBL fold metallo-hydrolase [Acidimicrobiia bacterium]
MSFEPVEPIHLPPLEVAADTFLIRAAQPALGAPLSVALNSLVIRGAEPVIVDTGTTSNRQGWLDDVFSLVEPGEVRWVVLSHEDHDHVGNLTEVLDRCPQATVVANWALTERLGPEIGLPLDRLRWVDAGGTLDVGDRHLRFTRPPVYDSPTTRAVLDSLTGVLWASDAFATPMGSEPVDRVEDLPPPMWAEGFAMFHHHALAPWLSLVDVVGYEEQVAAMAASAPSAIVGAHTPLIDGPSIERAIELLATLPATVPPPHPDQEALEAIVATIGLPA